MRFFNVIQTTTHRVPETNILHSYQFEHPNTRTSPSFAQTPQSQTSLSGLKLNTNSLGENTYSNPPLRRRLFSNEMESQNFEPIEMMTTEIKTMTTMMEMIWGVWTNEGHVLVMFIAKNSIKFFITIYDI